MLLFKCSRILLYHHSVIEPTNLQLCPSTDYEIKERKKTKPFSTSHEGNNSGNWVQEQYTHRWISTKEQHRGIYLSFFCLFVWGFQLFFLLFPGCILNYHGRDWMLSSWNEWKFSFGWETFAQNTAEKWSLSHTVQAINTTLGKGFLIHCILQLFSWTN